MIYYNVTYYSPGTLFSENSSFKFPNFNLADFASKAKEIKERHGAAPYGFVWEKCELPDVLPEVNGFKVTVHHKVLEKSGMNYITGDLVFASDLTAREDSIMKSNLESNSEGIGIINKNSWKYNGFFNKKDKIVNWAGKVVRTGEDEDLMVIRNNNEEQLKIWQKEQELIWEQMKRQNVKNLCAAVNA